jgi:hypothetical protein
MVARAMALGNYDPSLYFHRAGSRREGDVSGRPVADGCERCVPGEFLDGGDWPPGVAAAAPVGDKLDCSKPDRGNSRSK